MLSIQTGSAAGTGIKSSPSMVRSQDLECVYGIGTKGALHALGPVSIEIVQGEFVSLVGPSGCGKSTFVRVLAGLTRPSAGELTIQPTGTANTVIATVFQDFGIFPWKTVLSNVELGLRVRGESRHTARARAHDWLSRLGLTDFAGAYPHQLSGGMRQRVAIARALVAEPDILLMDEPFASLDAQLRELMQAELLRICEEDRRTVVFVTHSLDEAVVLSDRVLVMSARPGRVIVDHAVPFARPRDPEIRGSAEFAEIREDLWHRLRDEVQAQLQTRNDPS